MEGVEVRYGRHVRDALSDHRPVVALESTILAHGLPRPDNLRVGREIEAAVREHGAVPATIGMIGGELIVGLDESELERLATHEPVVKLSVRDLAPGAVCGVDGATTVASTAALAVHAGIPVFATGGLGGVHRGAGESFDESADLVTLAQTPVAVVCAGVKSILDVGATLERLETLGITVVGYRTRRFPGFYLADSGFGLDWSLETPEQIAELLRMRHGQGVHGGAIVVANPVPDAEQLDPALHDRVLADALAELERERITGKAVTPFLLARFHDATSGVSLEVNVRLVLRNAALAAQIAVAHAVQPAVLAA